VARWTSSALAMLVTLSPLSRRVAGYVELAVPTRPRGITGGPSVVGPETVVPAVDGRELLGRSHVAVDVHLRAFAADADVTGLQYEELRAVYEEAAAALGHEPGGMEHAVWRFKSRAL
jgi:hypothetical protein